MTKSESKLVILLIRHYKTMLTASKNQIAMKLEMNDGSPYRKVEAGLQLFEESLLRDADFLELDLITESNEEEN